MTFFIHKGRNALAISVAALFLSVGCTSDSSRLEDEFYGATTFQTIVLNMILDSFPELLSYTHNFTPPSRGALGVTTTSASGASQSFEAGISTKALASIDGLSYGGYLGSLVGDIPLAGYNRLSLDAQSCLDEKANPGQSAHHHLFAASEGVLDTLNVRAVVLKAGGTKVAFVVVDVAALSQDMFDSIFALLQAKTGDFADRGQLVVSATHTHSGPGAFATRPFWKMATADVFVKEVFDGISGAAVDAIVEANNSLVPVELAMGTTTAPDTVVTNRRSEHYDNALLAPLDKNIGVFQLRKTADRTVLATVVNFAIHPTSLSPLNRHFSGDNVGQTMSLLESHYPGSVALFLNGAEGDVSPQSAELLLFAQLEQAGAQIKSTVVELTDTDAFKAGFSAAGELRFAHKRVSLPAPEVKMEYFIEPYVTPFVTVNIELVDSVETSAYFSALYMQSGSHKLTLATVPGEAITELGLAMKAEGDTAMGGASSTNHNMISGLSNGHIGYIVSSSQYALGGYEAYATLHGSGTADFLTAEVKELQTTVNGL